MNSSLYTPALRRHPLGNPSLATVNRYPLWFNLLIRGNIRCMRLTLAAALLLALAVPAAYAAPTPRVHLGFGSPPTVVGAGFHARERVTVTVTAGTVRLSKIVRSTLRGAVLARFTRSLPGSGCHQIAIKAVGASGDHAAWKSPPRSCGVILQP
jgi:hypothetical protein